MNLFAHIFRTFFKTPWRFEEKRPSVEFRCQSEILKYVGRQVKLAAVLLNTTHGTSPASHSDGITLPSGVPYQQSRHWRDPSLRPHVQPLPSLDSARDPEPVERLQKSKRAGIVQDLKEFPIPPFTSGHSARKWMSPWRMITS